MRSNLGFCVGVLGCAEKAVIVQVESAASGLRGLFGLGYKAKTARIQGKDSLCSNAQTPQKSENRQILDPKPLKALSPYHSV